MDQPSRWNPSRSESVVEREQSLCEEEPTVTAAATQSRPLHRSGSNRLIGGVCGGIAAW
ncbi:MAG: PspC domain-containing protein, partial [Acidobacteria bacterium]|nr:PspC domain-containing protein [Acidobacteriota bacterium]